MKHINTTNIDVRNEIFFVCGQCRWYDGENKKCPRCFPNKKVVEPTDNACLCFAGKENRRLFRNIPRR